MSPYQCHRRTRKMDNERRHAGRPAVLWSALLRVAFDAEPIGRRRGPGWQISSHGECPTVIVQIVALLKREFIIEVPKDGLDPPRRGHLEKRLPPISPNRDASLVHERSLAARRPPVHRLAQLHAVQGPPTSLFARLHVGRPDRRRSHPEADGPDPAQLAIHSRV
jgi:hypothetical protein